MNLKKSLKPIKKNILNKHRPFITIRRVYGHLSELTDEEILDYYHVQNIKELEDHIEHIKNILKKQIANYQEELKEIDACFCLDSKGDFKYLYPTQKEAKEQIAFTKKSRQIKLALYPCPYHCGWHLQKL